MKRRKISASASTVTSIDGLIFEFDPVSMEETLKQYFKSAHASIYLDDRKEFAWEKAQEAAPALPRGWWEFSKLNLEVKREFLRDFWHNALPYLPHVYAFLDVFFAEVKDLGIMLVQKNEAASFDPFLVYVFSNRLFFGRPPLVEKEIDLFKKSNRFPFPSDFLNFLRIHDGFSKGEDTGIFQTRFLAEEWERFLANVKKREILLDSSKVDPEALFPFYRSFNQDVYQCFFKDWYPDGEIGNVLCSLSEGTISNLEGKLGFQTFLDWLVFYMGATLER